MIKDLLILAATFIILKIINLPIEISIIIIMIVFFCICIKIYNETTDSNEYHGDPKYTSKSRWTQEDWDNWELCSKESMEEIYKNEFKLDENGNLRYKGDHL